MRQLLKKHMPSPVIAALQSTELKIIRFLRGSNVNSYDVVELTEEQNAQKKYKSFLGGGAEQWERRGEYQLHLLKSLGLKPEHKLLDVGCGPLRGGAHLIQYLSAEKYVGFDYNESFVKAARLAVIEQELGKKKPEIIHETNFSADAFALDSFDVALAFSVLNHCDSQRRELFFAMISELLKPGGKLIITHARWFKEDELPPGLLTLTNRIEDAAGLSAILSPLKWGWAEENEIFPILELRSSKERE